MKVLRAAAVLITCVLVASPARAEDEGVVAERAAEVEQLRDGMERLYLDAAAQHAALRRFVDGFGDRAAGVWPESLSAGPARDAVRALVELLRTGESADPGIDRPVPPSVAAEEAWPLWRRPAMRRMISRAQSAPESPVVDVYCGALADVASTPAAAAWDRFLQDHPFVASWRAANERLATARLVAAARAPTPLVALERSRVEVGPWEGWLQDLSEKDNRRQKVTVGALHVQQHEVTCAQYADFVTARAAQDADVARAMLPSGWELVDDGHARYPADRAKHPVTGVSYLQAIEYAEWLGMRLPTEDEWERIAAGAGDPRRFPWGDEARTFAHRGQGLDGPAPVDRFEQDVSREGVLGLAGNVKELVATHPDRKPVKGAPDADDRVIVRGGGYRTRPDECTTRWRWFIEAGAQEADVGFRLVIDDDELRRRERRERR